MKIGFNSRLDAMQAAILLRKLPFLNINNKESKLLNIIQNILIIKKLRNLHTQVV